MWWRQLQSNSTAVMFEGTSRGRSVWNCIVLNIEKFYGMTRQMDYVWLGP